MRELESVPQLEYLVAHHAEQDHSGLIPDVLARYPAAKLVCSDKAAALLSTHLHVAPERIRVVADGETISLGDKTLQFVYTPWVHWPETMSTYVIEDKVLFSCDFFGAHLATSSLFVDDEASVYEAAKRYYAEIMMPFRKQINGNLAKLDKLDIDVIAPSHGPAYDKPAFIMDAYKDWVSDSVKNKVVVPYVSMHGSTGEMISHLVEALMDRDIAVRQFELSTVDLGKLAIELVDAATIVIGSPTVLAGAHPAAVYAAFMANAIRPKAKFASIIGSFGWGGKTVEQLTGLMSNLKVELLDPVLVKGQPKEAAFVAIDRLADEILAKHKEAGIVD
jgi:flavorubredoxin